jgi:hypothetical protein
MRVFHACLWRWTGVDTGEESSQSLRVRKSVRQGTIAAAH